MNKKRYYGGGIIYGYKHAEGYIVENEKEQRVINLIHQFEKKGYSLREMAKRLEKKGFKTKKGKSNWQPRVISRYLKKNTKYY